MANYRDPLPRIYQSRLKEQAEMAAMRWRLQKKAQESLERIQEIRRKAQEKIAKLRAKED